MMDICVDIYMKNTINLDVGSAGIILCPCALKLRKSLEEKNEN